MFGSNITNADKMRAAALAFKPGQRLSDIAMAKIVSKKITKEKSEFGSKLESS